MMVLLTPNPTFDYGSVLGTYLQRSFLIICIKFSFSSFPPYPPLRAKIPVYDLSTSPLMNTQGDRQPSLRCSLFTEAGILL